MNEIQRRVCTEILDGLSEMLKRRHAQLNDNHFYDDCCLQDGSDGYLKITVKHGEVNYFLNDSKWDRTPTFRRSLTQIDQLNDSDWEPVAAELSVRIRELFFTPQAQPVFQYKLTLVLDEQDYRFEDPVRKAKLRQKMQDYVREVIFGQKRNVKDNREIVFFFEHLLDFNLMEYDADELIGIIEQLFKTLQIPQNKTLENECRHALLYHLQKWKEEEFLPLYYDVTEDGLDDKEFRLKAGFDVSKVDQKKLRLYIAEAVWRIKYSSYSGDTQFAREDLERAYKELGSALAGQYLKKGTGILPDKLIRFKDNEVECNANDVFTAIKISIKNETAAAYGKALDFVINLLEAGFPGSYQIKYSSKTAKHFLPIKGLAKSQTHRFFAHALQYPELHPKLAQYALSAMKEFEWYNDDAEADEKCCMPGSYAVFGLALADEKYFPLLKKYFESVDEEHQRVQYGFIEAFIDRYGINTATLPLICAGACSGQFNKPFKNAAKLMTDETAALLKRLTADKSEYCKETVYFMLYGKNFERFKI